MEKLWNTVKYEVLKSPAGVLFTPVVVSLDLLTQQMHNCRAMYEQRVSDGDVDVSTLEDWRCRLEQMEWEHVRRLERNGRSDDPYVLWKKGMA